MIRSLVRGVRRLVLGVHLRAGLHHALVVYHRVDGGGDVRVGFRGDGGEDGGAERGRVCAFGSSKRNARDVGVYLHPQVGSRGPPRDHHLLGIVSVGAHGVEDETRAEGDAFEDGAVHVRATVPEGETGDDPATQRIDVRVRFPCRCSCTTRPSHPGGIFAAAAFTSS